MKTRVKSWKFEWKIKEIAAVKFPAQFISTFISSVLKNKNE